MDTMQIKANELKMMPSSSDYAEYLHSWRSQKSTQIYNPLTYLSLEKLRKSMALTQSSFNKLSGKVTYRWFIFYNERPVAYVTLKKVMIDSMVAEIGYGVDEAYQGKGIGKKSVNMLISKVFMETKLRRLIAFVHIGNIPSCKILDALGFKREGLLREHFFIDDKTCDVIVFGLLREEFN